MASAVQGVEGGKSVTLAGLHYSFYQVSNEDQIEEERLERPAVAGGKLALSFQGVVHWNIKECVETVIKIMIEKETCTSDVLVGLKEVAELLLERVDQGVVGAVQEEGLHRIWKELIDRRSRMMTYVKQRVGCSLVWKASGRPLSALTSEG